MDSSRAVRFNRYGGTEVLEVVQIPRPQPGRGQVLVEVVAAATNPGEIAIRQGTFAERWPAEFPEGQGNDYSGTIATVGPGVEGFSPGDPVMGFAPRRAQAEHVLTDQQRLAIKPAEVGWATAATLPGVGATAVASVDAVGVAEGDTVVVSAAAGGVGVLAAQLARRAGARVIGTASERNFDFLRGLGITPIRYGPDLAARIRGLAPEGVQAYLDNFGDGNVAVAVELGIARTRINTIADPEAPRFGVRTAAQEQADSPTRWRELAALVAQGDLVVPIHGTYPLDRVRDAYDELARRHTRGKIVLQIRPGPEFF
jgi:NADPH:quinone reductase-like Zn-dependent oxidoreductase